NGTALCVVAAAAVGSSAAPGRFGAVGPVLGGIEPSVAVVLQPIVADDVRRGARLAGDFGPAAALGDSDPAALARSRAVAAGVGLVAVAALSVVALPAAASRPVASAPAGVSDPA